MILCAHTSCENPAAAQGKDSVVLKKFKRVYPVPQRSFVYVTRSLCICLRIHVEVLLGVILMAGQR